MPAKIDNPNMGNNTNPVKTPEDIRSKYADYFVSDSNKNLVSIDTFFQLLLAEMTNQDPLEPTSNTEFVSQLANFTALQTNSDSLYYNTVSYASSLAGKTVTVATKIAGSDDKKTETGVVTNVDISDDNKIELTVNGKKYALKDIIYVSDGSAAAASTESGVSKSDGAYAVSLIGKTALVTGTTAEDETLLDEGIVESVEYKDGEYRVVVNGVSFGLDDVVRVRETEAAAAENPPTNTTTSTGADGAFAVSLIGKKVLVAGISDDGEDAYGEGIVDSIEIVDGEYRVVIGDYAFALSSVVRVSNPDPEPDTDADTDAVEGAEGNEGDEGIKGDEETEYVGTGDADTETSIMDENEGIMELFS